MGACAQLSRLAKVQWMQCSTHAKHPDDPHSRLQSCTLAWELPHKAWEVGGHQMTCDCSRIMHELWGDGATVFGLVHRDQLLELCRSLHAKPLSAGSLGWVWPAAGWIAVARCWLHGRAYENGPAALSQHKLGLWGVNTNPSQGTRYTLECMM